MRAALRTTLCACTGELAAHGIAANEFNVPDYEPTAEGLHALLKSLFRVTPPTALIVVNPDETMATCMFLARLGMAVPGDSASITSTIIPTMWAATGFRSSSVSGDRQHQHPHGGIEEQRDGKGKRRQAHPALVKPARRARKEEHGGEEDRVAEVAAGMVARDVGLLLRLCRLRVGVTDFLLEAEGVKTRDEGMRGCRWIIIGLEGDPLVVGRFKFLREPPGVEFFQLHIAVEVCIHGFHPESHLHGLDLPCFKMLRGGLAFKLVRLRPEVAALAAPA